MPYRKQRSRERARQHAERKRQRNRDVWERAHGRLAAHEPPYRIMECEPVVWIQGHPFSQIKIKEE